MKMQNIENCLNYCNMKKFRLTGLQTYRVHSGHIKGPTCAYPVSVGAKQ